MSGISWPTHTQLSFAGPGYLQDTFYTLDIPSASMSSFGAQLHPPALGSLESLSWFAMKAHSLTSSAVLGVCLKELSSLTCHSRPRESGEQAWAPLGEKPTHHHFDSAA